MLSCSEVLEHLRLYGPKTGRQLNAALGPDAHKHLRGLFAARRIAERGTHVDRITGRRAMLWAAADRQAQ